MEITSLMCELVFLFFDVDYSSSLFCICYNIASFKIYILYIIYMFIYNIYYIYIL